MNINSLINAGFVFIDGGMGTQLQEKGLLPGEAPELWNITHSDIITSIHSAYFKAGANIATSNTFGANPIKCDNYEELVFAAIENAKKARFNDNQFVALDIGPTGKLLKPLGDLDFEDAYNAFAKVVKTGSNAGADLIIIETMNDPYELKAAILAAKDNSSLPIFATFVLDERGKTITGCDIPSMVALLEGLGVDALGVNCSLGAKQLKKFVPEIIKYSSLPVIVNPNAGMPCVHEGKTCYDSTPTEFSDEMREIASLGARIMGGCCGTTPMHIKMLVKATMGIEPIPVTKKDYTIASS
jgi:5-methyltetrahydrofolate--homocysteine methyltransferase